jgi:hypothetical protein
MLTRLITSAAVASLVAVSPAAAQLTIDFTASDGGFTSQSLIGSNAWSWSSGTGWAVNTVNSVSRQRLLSPVLTAQQASWGVVASHAFDFEERTAGGCFDGGALFVSINGGAFTHVNSGISGVGYRGPISTGFSNPLGGLDAFCDASGGLVSTTLSGSANIGDTFQFAFDGAWDSSVSTPNPNWLLAGLELRGFGGASSVPEPGSLALLGLGLVGLAGAARRRRTT